MRRQGWTYIRENMNTDNPVAYYVNQNGYTVFYVVCTRDGYITTNVIDGIKPHFISYSEARKMNNAFEDAKRCWRCIIFSFNSRMWKVCGKLQRTGRRFD